MIRPAKLASQARGYGADARRWTPLREVQWRRLSILLIAAFLLFSVIGFFNDLMSGADAPYAIVLIIATVSGLNAVLWIIVMSRFSRWAIVPMVALQFAIAPLLQRITTKVSSSFSLHPVTMEHGMRFAASSILLVMIGSYFFFMWFFRLEGLESARIRRELELAHGIQATLVPPIALRTARWDIYGVSWPSHQVGGDLVDAVRLDDGDAVAYVADIAGHGLQAGILMGMLKTAARAVLQESGSGERDSTLPRLLESLNRVLPGVKEPQMYATLAAFRLSEDGSAWYSMAASPPVLIWKSGRHQRLQQCQLPLGLLPVDHFTGERIEISVGDLLVVATDGLIEVCDQQGQEYGLEGIESLVEQQREQPLEILASAVIDGVRSYGAQIDDQTLLLIRRVG